MIRSIELQNWRTHGATRLTFTSGTNILIGQMGAGKSSIMDAISFALFGTFPAIKHKRTNVDGLIRNRPSQEKKAKIKLDFTVDNDSYVIERELELGGSSKATIEKNGTYVQSQPQRVNEEIEKILKIDYDLFSKAIYSEQNRLTYFLELRPSERKKEIDSLLGLDRFALAQENVGSLINKIKDMASQAEKTAADFDIEKLKEQLKGLNGELKEIAKEKARIESNIESLKKEKEKVEEKLHDMKEQFNKRIELSKEIAQINSRINVLKEEIKKIDERKVTVKVDIAGKIKELEDQLKKEKESEKLAVEAERKAQTQLAETKAQLSNITKKIIEKEKLAAGKKEGRRKEIEARIEENKVELESLETEHARCKANKAENERWIAELEKHMSTCPVCERELPDEMRKRLMSSKNELIKDLEKRIKEAGEAVKDKREENGEITEELNKLILVEKQIVSYGNLEEEKAKVDQIFAIAGKDAVTSKEAKDRVSELISAINEQLSSLKLTKEMFDRRQVYIADKEKAETTVASKTKEYESIGVDEKRLDTAQKEFTQVSSDFSKSMVALEANSKYMKDKNEQISEKNEEIERIDRIYEDVKSKRAVVENLIKFRNALEETQAILRNKLINSINETMQEMWPELYPYGDYPAIMLEATAEDYVLKVKTNKDGEAWEEVEAIASGGERSIGCMAMRIAFALVLVPNLRWLILDEPTHNIDQKGLGKFVRVFNEILPKIVDQIFIITHDEMLKQVSNAKIYVLTRDKEENKQTVVQEL